MIGIAEGKSISPLNARICTRAIVALELCRSIVTTVPTSTPRIGYLLKLTMMSRIRSLLSSGSKASFMNPMPTKRTPNPNRTSPHWRIDGLRADDHHQKTDTDCGKRVMRDLEHREETDEPRGERRADIGAEHDGQGLLEGHQPRVDETDQHHRHGAAALYQGGHAGAHQKRYEPVLRQVREDVLETVARDLSQALRHELHAEEEEAEAADELESQVLKQGTSPVSLLSSASRSYSNG